MSSATVQKRRAKQRRRDRQFIAWLVGSSLVVLALVAWLAWLGSRPPGASTVDAMASPALDESALLPLAQPVKPIYGFHDMSNLPSGPAPALVEKVSAQQPHIDLPLGRWDWGDIPRTPPVQKTFPIQNTGDKPLLISSVVTSCGCTTAELSSSVIPPGERADLVVVFDPNFHETSGPVSRTIWLETNDPGNPLIELRADANVGS